MPLSADRQAEANRRNATRSTGPTSAEGKARSRLNGLRHGLAAETVITDDERAALDASVAALNDLFTPDHVVEADLVRRVAVARVRMQRCVTARESGLSGAAREALRVWDERRRHAARRRGQRLATDPEGTVEALEQSAFGCDWLIGHWQALDAPLSAGRSWSDDELARALRLCGLAPEVAETHPAALQIRRLAAPDPLDPQSEPNEHITLLRQFVSGRLDRLRSLRGELWEVVDAPEREAARLSALADAEESSRPAHRFEREAEMSYHRNLNTIIRVRTENRRAAEAARKEAQHATIPREHVGGGWWRERDAAPSPPGHRRLGAAEPGPLTVDEPGAPRRSEPISPAELGADDPLNPHNINELRNEPASAPGLDPRRTSAHPEAHRGAPSDDLTTPARPGSPVALPRRADPGVPAARAEDAIRKPITSDELRTIAIGRDPRQSRRLDGRRRGLGVDLRDGRLGDKHQ